MLKQFFILLFTFTSLISFGQSKEGNWWVFARNLTMNFNTVPPTLGTGSIGGARETGAAQSDVNGNLLFYSDGMEVWDRNHNVMPNGAGLNGDWTSTQNSLSIPDPGDPDRYYLFTVGGQVGMYLGTSAKCACLSYSIIDMNQNGGLGDVITKNVFVMDTIPENITAIRHANKCDVWITVHKFYTNQKHAYLLTSAGLAGPVISTAGQMQNNVNQHKGAMKASPDGTRIAAVNQTANNSVEIFDFDNSTGAVSYVRSVGGSGGQIYGLDFSPNSQVIYYAESQGKLWQLDLSNPTSTPTLIFNTNMTPNYGAIQLAPNGKVYISRSVQLELGVINNPDVVGMGCNYVDQGFDLGGEKCVLGLSMSMPGFYEPTPDPFTFVDTCALAPTHFTIGDTSGVVSYYWDFDDGGALGYGPNPSHTYTTPGNYKVKVLMQYVCKTETLEVDVQIANCGNILAADISSTNISCYGSNDGTAVVTPTSGTPSYTYDWQPGGATDSSITGLAPGTYTVTVTDNSSAQYSGTVIITEPNELIAGPLNDITICDGDTVDLIASASGGTPNYSFVWDGSTNGDSITVSPTDTTAYTVEVTDDNGCKDTDTVTVNVAPAIVATAVASPGNVICNGDSVLLIASGGFIYSWAPTTGIDNPNAQSTYAYPTNTTTYSVSVSAGKCAPDVATVTVTVVPDITAGVSNDTVICLGDAVDLTANGGTDYAWTPDPSLSATTGSVVTATPSVTTSYTVTVTSGSCAPATDEVTITVNPVPTVNVGSDTTIVEGNSVVINSGASGMVSWSPASGLDDPSSANPTATPTETTTYYVTVTDANGCFSIDSITITVQDNCGDLFIPTAFSPNGDGVNDEFFVRSECIESLSLIIFDRWGEKVFETTNPNEKWNGVYQSSFFFNTAVFDYHVAITLKNGEVIQKQGSVTLIR